MRWTVSITEYAHRDKSRLVGSAPPTERQRIKAEIEAAFRTAADDPRKFGEIMPGDRFQRVLDVGGIRLILDLNRLGVSNPNDDLICWVIGVMLKPD